VLFTSFKIRPIHLGEKERLCPLSSLSSLDFTHSKLTHLKRQPFKPKS